MLSFSEGDISIFLQQYFLPLCRIGAMVMVMPVIGTRIVPARVRLVLALAITLIVVPLLPPLTATPSLSLSTMLYVVRELAIGLASGFCFQLVFQVFVVSGQYMAMKMGLGFASMNDPTNGVQTTVLSQFFLMLVTLLFVSVDGHLVLIRLICASFQSMPAGQYAIDADMFFVVVSMASWMFAAALVFALPVLTSLLLVNIAFGVMSRSAPQLNIFAVGFPFTLICGLLLIWLGLVNFNAAFDNAINYGYQVVGSMLGVQ